MNISKWCFDDIHSPTFDWHIFEFEKNFDYWGMYFWFVDNWTISLYFIGVYLVAIFFGSRYMKSRPPFKLRGPLFLWNLVLALFSIVCTVRVLPEMISMLNNHGFYKLTCEPNPVQHKQLGSIWGFMFLVSKILELGDTAFIILRKTPLIFLHWYHHVSVILFSWGSCAYPSTVQQFFSMINIVVHSFMYSYYALKVLGFKIPRAVSLCITSLQLIQMILGVFIAVYAYRAKSVNPDCCVFDQAIYIAVAIYASYFVLFLNYFIRVYIVNKGSLFDEKGSIKKLA